MGPVSASQTDRLSPPCRLPALTGASPRCWDERVTERDPFGRLPGENTLAGLGVPSGDADAESPEPVVSAGEPVTTARPAAREGRPAAPRDDAERVVAQLQRGAPPGVAIDPQAVRTIGRAVKTVFFIAVLGFIGTIGLVVFSAGTSVKERFDELPSPSQAIQDVGRGLEDAREDGAGGGAGAVPRGVNGRSLLARRNLEAALRRGATSGLGRLKSMSIRPERSDAQLLTQGGRLRSVQLRYDGELRKLSLSGAGFAQLNTIAFAKLDPAAPSRLARSAAGRLKRPVSQVGYVVPIVFGEEVSWSVFMLDGRSFLGDARGRVRSRIG